MRFLPTRVHAVLDYLVGLLLVAAPWTFGFADGGAAQWTSVLAGAGALVYAPLTRYELGVAPVLSMRAHLALDAAAGALLALSPFLFGFADRVAAPHLILGLFSIGASLVTRTQPGLAPRAVRRP